MSVRSLMRSRRVRSSALLAATIAAGLVTATVTAPSASADPVDQTVSFTSSPPSPAQYGGTYVPTASASSGLGVTISLDAGSTGCTLNSGTLTFTSVGTCKLKATQGGNSSFNPASATQQFTIDPAPLTLTVQGGQTYGASSTAYFIPSGSGFKFGDDNTVISGTLSCTSPVTAASAVGTYGITGCSGLSAANYTVSYSLGSVTVRPASLTITASSGTFTYGGAVPTITPQYAGFVNGQNASVLTTAPTCSTTATSTSAVGTYPSSCSGAAAANYDISYGTGAVTVTRASLVITAGNGSFTYGNAVPSVTPTYAGFVNGDTSASLTTAPTCTTNATSGSPAGSYTTSCSGAVAKNYTIAYQNGTMTVNKRTLTVTAPSPTVSFGGAIPPLTPTYSGFGNGDSALDLATQASCSTAAISTSPVGTYAVTCSGASGSNYTINYVAGTLSIVPAILTISPSSATIAYGSNPPAITPFYDGFLNGDSPSTLTTLPTCSTTVTHSTPVGTYQTSCSGAASSNYTIQYTHGTLTVIKAELNVAASDRTRPMGAANSFAYTITGFKNGETASVVSGQPAFSVNADASSEPGMYPITPSQGTLAASNYSFSFSIGWLTVTKGTPTLTAAPAKKSEQLSSGKMTFSATATNSISHLPVANIQLAFSVKVNGTTLTCTAFTDATGTASCKLGDGRLLFASSYTVSFAGNYDYVPASATGKIS